MYRSTASTQDRCFGAFSSKEKRVFSSDFSVLEMLSQIGHIWENCFFWILSRPLESDFFSRPSCSSAIFANTINITYKIILIFARICNIISVFYYFLLHSDPTSIKIFLFGESLNTKVWLFFLDQILETPVRNYTNL